MKYEWKDLPKPLSCFTVRNATMVNLNTGKVVRYYSANTKIVVVQKCVTPECTYYRTYDAYHNYLNFAFKASAFGLPDEKAPSAPSPKSDSLSHTTISRKPKNAAPASAKKQTANKKKKVATPKDGGDKRHFAWLKKLLRRKNG